MSTVRSTVRRARHKGQRLGQRVQSYRFRRAYPEVSAVIEEVVNQHRTYLSKVALKDLAEAILVNQARGIGGVIVEAGAGLGGSAVLMASVKEASRPMRVYDRFGMIPPPTDKDGPDAHERFATIASGNSTGIGGETYYGYRSDLFEAVQESFIDFGIDLDARNVILVAGLFHETMEIDYPVMLAHIDCDWYDPVMTCLERIAPWVEVGGRLVIDDYGTWSGCRRAVDDYFDAGRRRGWAFEMRSRLHVLRVGSNA